MFLCDRMKAFYTNIYNLRTFISLVFDHSGYHVYTTDSLLSYAHTVVSVCQDLFSESLHCSLCLDMVFQPSGTHLSCDSTSAKGLAKDTASNMMTWSIID